jgi:hypothetical protein
VTRVAHHFILILFIAILFASLVAIPLQAQTGSVRLEGIIRDPSGNPLPNSTLTAVDESTSYHWEALSDKSGRYGFPALPPGIYTVTAKAKDLKDVIHRGIFLFSPGSTIEDFNFEVSEIDKEIGPEQRFRIQESDMADSFSRQNLEALPLLNRDPLQLLVYQPGVQIKGGAEGESTINGTRQTMNALTMDGLSITDPVDPRLGSPLVATNPDSLTDIQIITTGGNAEYGNSGGAQIVMTSRPGSQSWSGNVYDYYRNSGLDANDFFNNKYGLPRPFYYRNIYGATVSGPIGGKTLLFTNFEGNRTNQRLTRNRLVLTETAKSGVFQWYTPDDTVRDETTVQSFDIPANDPRGLGIDPSVAAILAKLPLPNNFDIGDGLNSGGFQFDNHTYFDEERVAARVDHNLNANHRIFFRFNFDRIDATDVANNADATFPGEPSGTQVESNYGFAAGSEYRVNPNMVNELRVGYLRPKTEFQRSARSNGPMLVASSWTNPLDPSYPRAFHNSIFEISDSLSYLKNLHSFKFGGTFRRTLQGSVDYSGAFPNVTFGTDDGNSPGSIGPSEQSVISSADRATFDNLYNDLLGRMESVDQTFYSSLTSVLPAGSGRDRNYAYQEYGLFVQDNWKIRPNLTLNLGLRYELNTAPKEKNGFQAELDQLSQISDTANISNFSIAQSDSRYDLDLKNFAPRAGFAWDIFHSGALILRGSYGRYYDHLIGGITNFVDRNSYGFAQDVAIYPNAAGTDVRLSDGIPLPAQPAVADLQPPITRSSTVAILEHNLRTPHVDHFSLRLERRLFGAILEAGYVGTRGKNLFQFVNLNQTKTNGDFLEAFQQLQEYRANGTPVPQGNTLIRIFGTPLAALNALGGMNFDTGQMGIAADTLDRNYYVDYAPAGVSDFYLRNFPQFDQFLYGSNSAESWYDSLQLGMRKSTVHYDLRVFYTWSKSLDTISTSGAEFVSPSDSFHPKLDKAPSDFGRTHVFNIAWNYALPFLRDRDSDTDMPKWVQGLFGGWNLGTLWIWESGAPFSVSTNRQTSYGGVNSLADYSGSRYIGQIFTYLNEVYWIGPNDAALFSYPAPGEVSTSGRNSFTGPGYFNLDLLLHKKFWTGEKSSIQFRAEAYNLFNNTRYALPNTNLSDSNFGIVTSTVGNPRILQVALRYQF